MQKFVDIPCTGSRHMHFPYIVECQTTIWAIMPISHEHLGECVFLITRLAHDMLNQLMELCAVALHYLAQPKGVIV